MLFTLLRRSSIWTSVQSRPLEFSFRVEELIKKDKNLRKVNLAANTYRDINGRPFVFQNVKKAKELLLTGSDHEYLPIEGLGSFIQYSQQLALGDTTPYIENRVPGIQTVGGTGGIRLALAFINRFMPKTKAIYITRPSSYSSIIKETGFEVKELTYYDPNNKEIDFTLMLEEIDEAPKNSVFILQSCGHDTTGTDLNVEQWKVVQDLMATKQHLTILDSTYQGLVTDLEKDAYPVKLFANEENHLMVVQSFSRNLGLGGERIGALSVVCDSVPEAGRVLSQLKILARAMYSNPPVHGSKIVSTVLGKNELKKQWSDELRNVTERLNNTRKDLVQVLREKGSAHDWSHLNRQKGLYAHTGLDPEQCSELVDKHHIYLGLDGKISVAGINKFNIDYVADALESVTRFSKRI
jgi:aspartate aminotransferase, mitochondrial